MSFSTNVFSQNNKTQSFSIKNSTLVSALKIIEKKYDINFSYGKDLIKNKKVTLNFTDLTLEQCLLKIFRDKNIMFENLYGTVVLSKKNRKFYKKYSVIINGKVSDKNNNIPLPDAIIKIANSNIYTISNNNGKFQFSAPFVPYDTLVVKYMGYKDKKIAYSDISNKSNLNIELEIKHNKVEQVIIEDNRKRKNLLFNLEDKNGQTINIESFADAGGIVDKDLFKIAQLLPGLNNSNESSSDFSIRGGMNGQNLIVYDNIVMYHYGHFMGKVSSINSGFADKLTITKEAYKPEHSGRISGVVSIVSSDSLIKKTELNTEINLMDFNIWFKQKLFKNKVDLAIGYRSSINQFYNNKYYESVFKQNFQNSKYTYDIQYIQDYELDDIATIYPDQKYFDFNTKINYRINTKNSIHFSFIKTNDNLNYKIIIDKDNNYNSYSYEADSLNISNLGYCLNWDKKWSSSLNGSLILSSSQLKNNLTLLDQKFNGNIIFHKIHFSEIADNNIRFVLSKKINSQSISVSYNFNYINQDINIDFITFNNSSNDVFVDKISSKSNNLSFEYINNKFKKIDFYFTSRIFHYNLTKKFYFEPRGYILFKPHKFNLRYKFSAGLYYQTKNKIYQSNGLNAEYYVWVLSRKDTDSGLFSVAKNFQYSASVFFNAKKASISISAFQKNIKNAPSRIIPNGYYNPYRNIGLKVKGLELFFQHTGKYLYSILSYTYLYSELLIPELINNIPPDYDIPHQLKLLQGIKYKGFNLSGSFNFSSGMPYTPYDNIIEITDENGTYYELEFTKFNSKHLNNYYRLDLTFSYKFKIKKSNLKILLSAINVLDKTNILNKYYTVDYPDIEHNIPLKIRENNKIGLPRMFNIGLVFNFGK